jgi:hypothetical protein
LAVGAAGPLYAQSQPAEAPVEVLPASSPAGLEKKDLLSVSTLADLCP